LRLINLRTNVSQYDRKAIRLMLAASQFFAVATTVQHFYLLITLGLI
jgi:hypothetical protein